MEPFSQTFNIRCTGPLESPLLPCTPLYLIMNNNNKYISSFSVGTSNTHLDTHIFSYRTMKRVIDAFGCRMDLRNLPFDTHVCRIEIFSIVPVQQVFVRIFLNFTASQKTDQSSTQFLNQNFLLVPMSSADIIIHKILSTLKKIYSYFPVWSFIRLLRLFMPFTSVC